MKDIQKYNKSIVAFGIPALFLVLSHFGLTPESTLKDALTVLLTTLGVYAVPNQQ